MKKLNKLCLYLSFFIIGFSTPVLLYFFEFDRSAFSNFFNKKAQTETEPVKNDVQNNTELDMDFQESIPLTEESHMKNLIKDYLTFQDIARECAKPLSDYDNKTRYEWGTLLSISQAVKKDKNRSFLEVTVDPTVWANNSFNMKELIMGNLYYCYPSEKKLSYINVLDAKNNDLLATFHPERKKVQIIKQLEV